MVCVPTLDASAVCVDSVGSRERFVVEVVNGILFAGNAASVDINDIFPLGTMI